MAALGYWRDRPRQTANRFIALIEAGNTRAAERMFDGDRVGISNAPSAFHDWTVQPQSWSAANWLRGRYPMTVRAAFWTRAILQAGGGGHRYWDEAERDVAHGAATNCLGRHRVLRLRLNVN
jgi:hypothetical protein